MTESVVLVSASPDTGASLWAGSGLKLSYRWGAGIASEPKSAVFIALEFDRKGGGVVSCPVAGPMVRREGGDSAFLFLTGLTKSLVAHPSTARLVLSETIEDSLVTVLAKSPVLSWKD